MVVKEMEWDGLSGIDLAEDGGKWPDVVDREMPIWVP